MQNQPVQQPVGTRSLRRKQLKAKRRKEFISWVRDIVLVVLVVTLLKTFVFSIVTVKGNSMLDTLESGDHLYVSMLSSRIQGYERGDIVICFYPGRTDRCVKRIVGLPGERLKIQGGVVYINDEPLEEEYLTRIARYYYPEITLGEGEYFVLGDNRPVSHDSHSSDVGPVTRIEGVVRCIIWPPDRIGIPE